MERLPDENVLHILFCINHQELKAVGAPSDYFLSNYLFGEDG